MLTEKYREGQKELLCAFVKLEETYDGVAREKIWYWMKKSGVADKVRVVDDIHEISKIMMRCVVGVTYQLKVEKEIHDWPFFVIGAVMDSLTDEL